MLPDPDASLFQIKLISKLDPLLPQNIVKSWVLCTRICVSFLRRGLFFCLPRSDTPPSFPSISSSGTDGGLGQTTGGICLLLPGSLPPAPSSCSSACPGLISHPPAPSSWKEGGKLDNRRCVQMGERKARSDVPQLWESRRPDGWAFPTKCLHFSEVQARALPESCRI